MNPGRVSESAEQQIARVLEPGERLLWSGKANSEAVRARTQRFALPLPLALLVFAGVFLWMLSVNLGIENLEDLLEMIRSQKKLSSIVTAALLIPVAGSILGRRFRLDRTSQRGRFLSRFSYGLTNQRVLILKDEKIQYSLLPKDIRSIYLRGRTRGYGDVVFAVHTPGKHNTPGDRGICFDSIKDAEGIRRRIEGWIHAHQEQAER